VRVSNKLRCRPLRRSHRLLFSTPQFTTECVFMSSLVLTNSPVLRTGCVRRLSIYATGRGYFGLSGNSGHTQVYISNQLLILNDRLLHLSNIKEYQSSKATCRPQCLRSTSYSSGTSKFQRRHPGSDPLLTLFRVVAQTHKAPPHIGSLPREARPFPKILVGKSITYPKPQHLGC
jgi:hypothetical protein